MKSFYKISPKMVAFFLWKNAIFGDVHLSSQMVIFFPWKNIIWKDVYLSRKNGRASPVENLYFWGFSFKKRALGLMFSVKRNESKRMLS
jgi:hypothetical protein